MASEQVFDLKVGAAIKRTQLHQLFGGSRQGGISASATTANIFIFSDPDTGLQHGYVDGWKSDGIFDYTGEGQLGDQVMSRGNAAILNHMISGRSLRLFAGTGGIVRYLGTFGLANDVAYYRADAPETNNGPTRSVIVFRLRPIDGQAQPQLSKTNPIPTTLSIRLVPMELQHTETFVVNPSATPTEADRREATLVQRFCAFIAQRSERSAVRHQINVPGEAKPLFTDIYFEAQNLLIEAKGSIERGAFRTAIGQLADYRRFLGAPKCAILLPMRPREDLLQLADVEGLAVVWQAGDGFLATEALW